MYKKLAVIFSGTLAASLLLAAAMVPLGVQDTIQNMNTLLTENEIKPQKIEIKSTVNTLDFSREYYGNILFRQSEDDSFYIETYDSDTIYKVPLFISYDEEDTKVNIYTQRPMGNFRLDEETLKNSLVKELQNYPDAIIYVPKTITIVTSYPYDIPRYLEFQNKTEFWEDLENN